MKCEFVSEYIEDILEVSAPALKYAHFIVVCKMLYLYYLNRVTFTFCLTVMATHVHK